jgi:hypothetical protein
MGEETPRKLLAPVADAESNNKIGPEKVTVEVIIQPQEKEVNDEKKHA